MRPTRQGSGHGTGPSSEISSPRSEIPFDMLAVDVRPTVVGDNPLDRDAVAGIEAPRATKAGQDVGPDTKRSAAGAQLRPRVRLMGTSLALGGAGPIDQALALSPSTTRLGTSPGPRRTEVAGPLQDSPEPAEADPRAVRARLIIGRGRPVHGKDGDLGVDLRRSVTTHPAGGSRLSRWEEWVTSRPSLTPPGLLCGTQLFFDAITTPSRCTAGLRLHRADGDWAR
jgi:hypothetical protein